MSSYESCALTLHTRQTNRLFRNEVFLQEPIPYEFPEITGIETATDLIGIKGDGVRVLEVPQFWAEQLEAFMANHTFVGKDNRQRFPTVNCFEFASFMTTGLIERFPPDSAVEEGNHIDVPGLGDHIVLGKAWSEDEYEAMHSAISLGEAAPGECIQVTAEAGVLALDFTLNLQRFYATAFKSPDIQWYKA